MKLLKEQDIPKQLLEIPDPPKSLYIVGTLPEAHTIYLTVVGSRNHTTYGRDTCTKLIEGLAGYPIVIVSGLALGIDAIAHETALRVGLTTMAFPGSGLDLSVIVPTSNQTLAKRIVESGGCLLSELPPNSTGGMWAFPRRNRLMAGIARAVLIIEAEAKSGTLITSKLATDYNRDVLAVPGSIFSKASFGTNMLIRLGATPVTRSEDILEVLGYDVHSSNQSARVRQNNLFDCSQREKDVLAVLIEPMTKDDLCEALGKPMHELNITLSVMELRGLIKEEYGEIRRL